MNKNKLNRIYEYINDFINWLDNFGEISYDHQSFFAGPIGGRAKELYYRKPKLGTMAVGPMIFCEAFLPSTRNLFWKKQRFPIADAHYAMGFAYLAKVFEKEEFYNKSLHFLEILKETRSPGYDNFCWGYPFNWVTRAGTIQTDTPLITTTPYVYEAFKAVYEIDKKVEWLEIMHSIAQHAIQDIKDFKISSKSSSCGYMPDAKEGGVINASAYRAFLLTSAFKDFSDKKYWQIAEKNLNFVLESQQPNGCWYYAADDIRDFIDHYHTCFVLKALVKIEKLTGHNGCKKAIENGIMYYIEELFDENKLPKPFSRAPRLTVYKKELYDYAECINLGVLLREQFSELDKITDGVLDDLFNRWQKRDGSFRSRKLYLGWDNVPMHRWAQAQTFRSICYLWYKVNQETSKF